MDQIFHRNFRILLSLIIVLVLSVIGISCVQKSYDDDNKILANIEKNIKLNPGGPPIKLVHFPPRKSGLRSPLQSFYIGKYEITNAQYKVFIDETQYDGSDHPSSKRSEPFLNDFKDGNYSKNQANYPVCYLNWWHANAYCDWLSRKIGKIVRLPTKDEWEYVAGGTGKRIYPWGNEWHPKRCNWGSDIDGFKGASPVGSFPKGATPEGVHDLCGNIWEWCEDRALRGEPWCEGPDEVTTTFSSWEDTDRADDKFGFRIVVEGK